MPLRCLVFSSNEEMVQPIWQVLTDLGIEGEYCRSAVDAVERVTTQLFQIVITDWEDQPEAAFLLKTARDLKAAQRPLTLAIVSDDATMPEALQAGANSVLLKPIRAEQVRDTMSTACQLLRAKQPPAASPATVPATFKAQLQAPETAVMAAAAGAAGAPASVTQSPEKVFRAGEFLQSSNSAPGTHFDTECDVQKSLDQAAAAEVDALTELGPTAAAVKDAAVEPTETQQPMTGWAALQARLTRAAPQTLEDASANNELLSYGETASYGVPAAASTESKASAAKESQRETNPEAALFAYMAGDTKENSEPGEPAQPKSRKILLAGILAVACMGLVAVPRTRLSLLGLYRNAGHVAGNWLNPQPAPVPQAVAQHESFGQEGDEYKFPAAGNIPDATTDPSQIHVLPVVDPTAKPAKNTEADSGQTQAAAGDSNPADQNQTQQVQAGQAQGAEGPVKDQPTTNAGTMPQNTTGAPTGDFPSAVQLPPNAPVPQSADQPRSRPVAPPEQSPAAPHAVPAGNSTAIPSSLKSQIASMTPEASGAKPPEAAMSSIEPVNLPESAVMQLLAQPVDPVYPDAARAAGQRGSVVLQLLIGRDGTVQEAKFLQGSLVFARAAIDAAKQWRFKPYSLNGRAVSVQSVVTLSFKPPA